MGGSHTSRLREILRFMRLFDGKTRYEINRIDDFRPFVFKPSNYLRHLAS